MKRNRVINDQIQRTTKEVTRAIDGMGAPGYDYALCVELATDSMRELVRLQQEFQSHLDAGTLLDEVEVFTETIYHTPFHDLIQYWRLLPGSDKPEKLFYGNGAFDFKDAARDRAFDWPNAVYISSTLFLDAIAEQHKSAFENALAHEQGAGVYSGVCVQCERDVTALSPAGLCEGCIMQAIIESEQ